MAQTEENKKENSFHSFGAYVSWFSFYCSIKAFYHHQSHSHSTEKKSINVLLNLKFNKRKFHSSNHDNHSDRIEYRNTFRCGFLCFLFILLHSNSHFYCFCYCFVLILKIEHSQFTLLNFPHPIRLFTV
jgi:hypothetical protein